MDPFTLVALGGLALLLLKRPSPSQQQQRQPSPAAPTTAPASPPPSSGGGGPNLGNLAGGGGAGAAIAIGGALGGAYGEIYNKYFGDANRNPGAYDAAPTIGAIAGGGLGLGLWHIGWALATGPVGLALVVWTLVAITDTIAQVKIVEGRIRNDQQRQWAEEWLRRYLAIQGLIQQGRLAEAWENAWESSRQHWRGRDILGNAVERPDLRYSGLGFEYGWTLPNAIPETVMVYSTRELAEAATAIAKEGKLPPPPDRSINLVETLRDAYRQSLETGDKVARLLAPGVPWAYFQVTEDGTRMGAPRPDILVDFAGLKGLHPLAQQRYLAKVRDAAQLRAETRQQMISSGAYAALQQELVNWRASIAKGDRTSESDWRDDVSSSELTSGSQSRAY